MSKAEKAMRLKEELKKLEQESAEAGGQLKELYKSLAAYDCKTLKELKAKVPELKKELAKLEQEYATAETEYIALKEARLGGGTSGS